MPSILVMDDDQGRAGLLALALEDRGYEVHLAADKDTALHQLLGTGADAVIADVVTSPHGTPRPPCGSGLIRAIRALSRTHDRADLARTPIVAVTGDSVPGLEADLVLPKPLLMGALERALARMTGG